MNWPRADCDPFSSWPRAIEPLAGRSGPMDSGRNQLRGRRSHIVCSTHDKDNSSAGAGPLRAEVALIMIDSLARHQLPSVPFHSGPAPALSALVRSLHLGWVYLAAIVRPDAAPFNLRASRAACNDLKSLIKC